MRGVAKGLLRLVDALVFDGHVPCATPADTLRFKAGRFGNYFGACVYDYAALPDGRFAVAYGEAGVVVCATDGAFLTELPRGEDGYVQVFASPLPSHRGKIVLLKLAIVPSRYRK